MATDDRLYFRQLLSGRDFAQSDMIAQQMRNFAYLIGDRETERLRGRRPGIRRQQTSSTRWNKTACTCPACSSPTTTPTTSAAR